MKTFRIPFLILVVATGVLRAQVPAAPAAKPDAAAEMKAVGAPYHAAVEAVSADYQKWVASLDTWYLAELDKLKAARAKLGDLDGAVAVKAERDRIASHAATTPEQIQAMPATLRKVRTGYDQGLKKSADEGARRIDTVRRKYLADLEALQKRITISGDIEQALAVKAEKERFIAEIANGSGTGVPQPPVTSAIPTPPGGAKVPVSSGAVPIGTRLAEGMRIYASGNNGCIIAINGKEMLTVKREKAGMLSHRLREGDVIAVKLTDRFDINSFWLSCIATSGEFLFETSERWTCYLPSDLEKWWNIKNVKERKPAEFATDRREYVDLVKRSASETPLYNGTQPICSVLTDGSRTAWVYYVVTKADLVPKKDRKPEAK